MTKSDRHNFLVKLLRWGVYAVAFVPLIIFADFISPFHFGKVLVFRSLIEIMAVFYFVLVLSDRNWLPAKHPLLLVFGLWTALFGITTITSINPYLSFWGSLERMGGFWTFAHYLVYFVIIISIFRTKEDWIKLFRVMIFVGFLSAIYGFGQKTSLDFIIGSGGRARIFGTVGNAALFAGYQIVIMFLALTLSFSSWLTKRERSFYLVAAGINLIAILMTAVRGSMLAVGVGLLVFNILYLLVFRSHLARKILTVLLGLVIFYLLFSFTLNNSEFVQNSSYLSRVTNISFDVYTVQTRFWAWEAGFTGWKENAKTILLGWGPENFNVPFSKYFNPLFFRGLGSETLFDRAHNMFVETLVTMGLVTLFAYVSLFIVAIKNLWKKSIKTADQSTKILGVGMISLIFAYVVHNFFIFDTSSNFIVFFSVLGFILWLTPKGDNQGNKKEIVERELSPTLYVLLLVLLMGALFLIYKTNILQSKANYATTRAILRTWANDFDGAVVKFREALSYDVPGKYEHRHRYAQYLLQVTNVKTPNEKEIQELLWIMGEVQKNVDENEQDYLPYLYLSRMNIILGKVGADSPYNDAALENSFKALEISPTFVRTYYEIGQAYLNKKDLQKAAEYFKKSIELNPDVPLSHWYLSATYFDMGEIDKGGVELEEAKRLGYEFSEGDILRLINIYLKVPNYQKIAELYEILASSKPNEAQYWASLAATYAQLGRIDEAVLAARKAGQIDPKYTPEAEAFIKSLGR